MRKHSIPSRILFASVLSVSAFAALASGQSAMAQTVMNSWTDVMTFAPAPSLNTPWTGATLTQVTNLVVSMLNTLDEGNRIDVIRATNMPTLLQRYSYDGNASIRAAVASNMNTPGEAITRLATDKDIEIRASIAATSGNLGLLEILRSDPSVEVRAAVAANSHATDTTLASLATDSSAYVRSQVAGNEDAPASILDTLSRDTEPMVRLRVAQNTTASIDTLSNLAGDAQYDIRYAVAGNTSASVDTLALLSRENDPTIRAIVAGNTSAPESVLVPLAGDTDIGVRSALAGNSSAPLAVLTTLSRDAERNVRVNLVYNSSAGTGITTALLGDTSEEVRAALANGSYNPLDELTLTTLSRDPRASVRASVALNANTSTGILATLATDSNMLVRANAVSNERAPLDLRRAYVRANNQWDSIVWEVNRTGFDAEDYAVLASNPNPYARSTVAWSDDVPSETLGKLAMDPFAEVRAAVAGNVRTAPYNLSVLSSDSDPTVRAAVAGNPSLPNGILFRMIKDIDMKTRAAAVGEVIKRIDAKLNG